MTTLREAIEFLQNRLRTECEYCDLAYLCDHTHKKCTFLESLEIAVESMLNRTLDNALDKGKQKDEEIRMLTDAEKAILRLTIIKDLFDDLSVNSNCVSVLLNREDELALKTAIETLKEQRPHGEWIPCSERVPKESGYYLVQTDGSHNNVIDIAEFGRLWSKKCEDFGWGWNKASRVIAWMPLPEPYKGE